MTSSPTEDSYQQSPVGSGAKAAMHLAKSMPILMTPSENTDENVGKRSSKKKKKKKNFNRKKHKVKNMASIDGTEEVSVKHGAFYFEKSGTDFLASQITSATSVAVRLKNKSKKARNKVKDKRAKLWRRYAEARDRKSLSFDSASWLHDHHDPKGRIAYKKKKEEDRKRRKKAPPPEPPPIKEQQFEYATMTPFLKMNGVPKRPRPEILLPLPTPMGRTNYEAIMGKYESFQDAMQGLHAKIVTKNVSKDFFRFVLDQERRMRERKKREAEEAIENKRKLKRALARIRKKKLSAAFNTWDEVWSTMKRMRALMRRVAGGTLSVRLLMWQEYTKKSVQERMKSFNNLSEYAIIIQSWTRMWQGVEWYERFRIETKAARCIQRMIMAHNCRNIMARYHRQKMREEELRRKCMNRLVRGLEMRVFRSWADWAYSVGRLRAFVKKHLLAGQAKAFHAWTEALHVFREERGNLQKLQAFMHKHMLGGIRKGFVAWQDAAKNQQLMRLARNRLVHGKLLRVWHAWTEHTRSVIRVRNFLSRWKNKELHHAFDTWHEEAHRAVRIRHLARKLFLGAAHKSFDGWRMIWLDALRRKHVAARRIQGLYYIWYGKGFLVRAREQIRLDEEAEKARLAASGRDSERHRLMRLSSDEPHLTNRYRLLTSEMKDAMETSTGYFESKALHDEFDLRQQGNFVMAGLRQEIVNETMRIVQMRSNDEWYQALGARETKKWGRGWERYYEYGPDEKIRREAMDIRTLYDHFPEDGIPTAGKSIDFQGTFQDFETGLRNSLEEWAFMEKQDWISHKQYIQWIVRGTMTNVKAPEKRLLAWNLLKEVLDENTLAEVTVTMGNNELIGRLGGAHMATHYMNENTIN